ncbi:CTHB5-like protein, partial [Mya arenaria]
TSAVDPQTILECLPREYTFRAFKPYRLKGKVLPCYDDVTYGDYKIPFKISHHPVCTYTDRSSRQVRLRRCHPDHPDPFYEVFDATECSCSVCNADNTSCENLNG